MKITHILYAKESKDFQRRVGLIYSHNGLYWAYMNAPNGLAKLEGPTYQDVMLRVEGAFRVLHGDLEMTYDKIPT